MKLQIRRKFSEEFKRKVALEVSVGHLNKEEARRHYGIKGKSAVSDWVRIYGDSREKISRIEGSLNIMTPQEREKFEALKAKITSLEEELNNEKHRAGLYRTMIEIAEEQLKIPIRKKYGAKQWKNTKPSQKK